MVQLLSRFGRLRKSLRGQTMTEYALILGAIAIVVYVTYQGLGNTLGNFITVVNNDLTTAS